MITQRAVLFGFVGLCFYLIAIVNALPPFYYSLTWLTAGILVSCFGVALLSLFALQCEWSVPGSTASEWLGHDVAKVLSGADESGSSSSGGQANFDGAAGAPGIEIDIANSGTLNKTDIVLEVRLREIRSDEVVLRRFLLEALPAGGHLSTRLPLHDLPRGRYRVEEMRLVGSDVLGLFRLRKRVPAKGASTTPVTEIEVKTDGEAPNSNSLHDIVVGPAMIVAPEVKAWLRLGGANGGLDASASLGQGDEVRGTRPYTAGDDLRFVHWKTTARRGELVVREFHRTARNQCVIVWDGAAIRMNSPVTDRTATNGWKRRRGKAGHAPEASDEFQGAVEFSLRVTASLCRTIIESGQPCALLRLDNNPVLITADGVGNGAVSTLARVSEALADAEANRSASLLQALSSWMSSMASGSGLYIVTASPAPDLVAAIQSLRARRSNVAVCIVDPAALSTLAIPNTATSPSQSTLTGTETSKADAGAGLEALRASGVSIIMSPHPEAIDQSALNRLSADERRSYLEAGAIRVALREILQGASQASMPAMASHTARDNAMLNNANGRGPVNVGQRVAS